MAFIFPAPGVSGTQATLEIRVSGDTSALNIPAMQDVTVNNSNDVFTWTQLDAGSKQQVPTTATNSIDMNLVLDQTIFFGDGASSNVAINKGIFGLSKDKTLVSFAIFLGKTSTGAAGKSLTGTGYITGLAPSVSADSPVWVSPVTITVTGDYTEVPA